MEFEIKQEEKESQGEFYVEQKEEKTGSLRYLLFGSGRMIIQHTEVSRDLQGSGASHQLLDAAVDYARERSLKIVPLCPFAKAVMTRHREQYEDVLA